MTSKEIESRVLQLADEVCNGTLSEASAAELSRLLDRNPEAQRVYAAYLGIHSELYWSECRLNKTKSGVPLTALPSQATNWLRNFGTWSLLLLAGVLLGGWGWQAYFLWQQQTEKELAKAAAIPKVERVQVAIVSGTRNARWNGGGNGGGAFPGYLDPVFAGEVLWLQDGLAELTFESGVRAILEGPARIEVRSEQQVELLGGHLTLLAGESPKGFSVLSRGVALIPESAEFGLVANADQQAELHVFSGKVEADLGSEWGEAERTRVFPARSLVAFDFAECKVEPIELSDTRFVQSLMPPTGPANGIFAKEDFEYTAAPLSEQNGGFGWADGWSVMSAEGNDPLATNLVSDGNLRFPGVSAAGNHAVISGQFNRVRRLFSTSFGGVFDSAGLIEDQDGARLIGREGRVVYISYLQRISQRNQGFYGFELHRGDGNRNRVLCVGHGAHLFWEAGPPRTPDRSRPATGWAVTSEFNGMNENSVLNLGDLGPEPSDSVLVVLKITFGPNHEDELEVFVDPPLIADESKLQPVVRGRGNFAFDRVGLANFDGRKEFLVDHVRVGNSFAAVTQELYDSVTFAGLWPVP